MSDFIMPDEVFFEPLKKAINGIGRYKRNTRGVNRISCVESPQFLLGGKI